MKLEVSIGEAVDKYSILELKSQLIRIPDKLTEIEKERTSILDECATYIATSPFFYSLLLHINKEIWLMTDKIKLLTPMDKAFAYIAHDIFEYNQIRFRLKTIFNKLHGSPLIEQKSYSESHCHLIVPTEECLYSKIAEINYLAIRYDTISFETPADIVPIIKTLFKNTNILYDSNEYWYPNTVYLPDYHLPSNVPRDVYSF
jgi:hypothetical protein